VLIPPKEQAETQAIVVLRSVIMNPMTTPAVLEEILDEQEQILRDLIQAGGILP
jgi:hypothetical protein